MVRPISCTARSYRFRGREQVGSRDGQGREVFEWCQMPCSGDIVAAKVLLLIFTESGSL
jgi:hypothetical protein